MPKQNVIITNFTSGELSPLMDGRVDVGRYHNGARIVENMITLPTGAAMRMPGTYYVAEAKDSSKKVRLVPFQFNVEQNYILEFGDLYIRFYRNGGQIQSGGSAVEVTTEYTEDELFELNFTQSADTLYISHKNHPPAKLTRSSHVVWTLTDISFTASPFTETAIAGAADNGSGLVRITATTHGLSTGNTAVIRNVVGTTEANGIWTITYVDANTFDLQGSTFAHAYTSGGTVSNLYPGAVAFFEERLYWAGSYGAPQTLYGSKAGDYENMTTGTGDDDGLEFTLLSDQVNAIKWMVNQNYLLIGTSGGEWRIGGASATEPLTPTSVNAKRQSTYGSADVQGILVNDVVLFVQRSGRKLREMAYDLYKDGFVAPDLTMLANHVCKPGLTTIAYQKEPFSILWGTRSDGVLVGMTYERAQESVVGWHRHTTTNGEYESVAIIPGEPEDEIWISVKRTVDGSTKRYIEYFQPMDFDSDQNYCFFVHSGLTWDGGDPVAIEGATQADPVVITSTAHGLSDGDNVYIDDVVGMTELNETYYTVANKTADTFELSGVDGTGFTAYASGGTAKKVEKDFAGLDHLEGEEVAVLADGGAMANETVSSGSISLDSYYNVVHVGLPVVSKLQPMRIEGGAQFGTAQGQTKRVDKLVVRFYETIGCKWGPVDDDDYLEDVPFGDSPELYSGDMEALFQGDYETDGNIILVQDQPLPMTVLCIIARMQTYD